MPVDISDLIIGNCYNRKDIASLWGYKTYADIAHSIITPADDNKIILFITNEMRNGRDNYIGYIDDNFLYMDGENDDQNDERMIFSKHNKDEVYLFYREIYQTDFKYYGKIRLIKHDRRINKSSKFVFLLRESTIETNDGIDTDVAGRSYKGSIFDIGVNNEEHNETLNSDFVRKCKALGVRSKAQQWILFILHNASGYSGRYYHILSKAKEIIKSESKAESAIRTLLDNGVLINKFTQSGNTNIFIEKKYWDRDIKEAENEEVVLDDILKRNRWRSQKTIIGEAWAVLQRDHGYTSPRKIVEIHLNIMLSCRVVEYKDDKVRIKMANHLITNADSYPDLPDMENERNNDLLDIDNIQDDTAGHGEFNDIGPDLSGEDTFAEVMPNNVVLNNADIFQINEQLFTGDSQDDTQDDTGGDEGNKHIVEEIEDLTNDLSSIFFQRKNEDLHEQNDPSILIHDIVSYCKKLSGVTQLEVPAFISNYALFEIVYKSFSIFIETRLTGTMSNNLQIIAYMEYLEEAAVCILKSISSNEFSSILSVKSFRGKDMYCLRKNMPLEHTGLKQILASVNQVISEAVQIIEIIEWCLED